MATIRILALALLPILFVSCGGGQKKITNVKLDQSQVGQDVYLHLSADLDLGNIYIPTFASEVELPGRGLVGDVEISSDHIAVNLLASAFLPRYETLSKLPNGASLPLIGNNPVVAIPVGRGQKVNIYVSLVNGAPTLGVSFLVGELDRIGSYSAIIPPFLVQGVQVAAGVFTSEDPGESGIAAFFNLQSLFEMGGSTDGNSGHYYIPMMDSIEVYEFNYETGEADPDTQREIDRVLYRMHRKKASIELY